MGGSTTLVPPPPDPTLGIAQIKMQMGAGQAALENQNRLLKYASELPVEAWTEDIWGKDGTQAKAEQIAALNSFKSAQLEAQNNPAAAEMRKQLPKMLQEDTSPGAWEKHMQEWGKRQGLMKMLGTGLQDSTVGKSGYFDAATAEGQAFRRNQQAAMGAYLAQNAAPQVGLDPASILGTEQAVRAAGMQQRAEMPKNMLNMASGNAQSTTDWINQIMASNSQFINAHQAAQQNQQQALMDANAQNNASKNAMTGAMIGAGGAVAGGLIIF